MPHSLRPCADCFAQYLRPFFLVVRMQKNGIWASHGAPNVDAETQGMICFGTPRKSAWSFYFTKAEAAGRTLPYQVYAGSTFLEMARTPCPGTRACTSASLSSEAVGARLSRSGPGTAVSMILTELVFVFPRRASSDLLRSSISIRTRRTISAPRPSPAFQWRSRLQRTTRYWPSTPRNLQTAFVSSSGFEISLARSLS